MKIRAVVFEFLASRQTDRRGGGLCFIICIDIDFKINDNIYINNGINQNKKMIVHFSKG
jgi:hypothetical protein